MDLRHILLVIRRRLLLIAVAGLVAGGVAYLVASSLPKQYEATAMLVVGQSITATDPNYTDLLASQQVSVAYAQAATTRKTLTQVITSLDLSITYEDLKGRVNAELPPDSPIITIHATYEDPTIAAAIANAIASEMIAASPAIRGQQADTQVFVSGQLDALRSEIQELQDEIARVTQRPTQPLEDHQYLKDLEGRLEQARSTYVAMLQSAPGSSANALTLVDPAVAPDLPSSPRIALLTLLAIIGALLGATALAFLLEYLDDRVASPEEAEAVAGLPTLGTIGRITETKVPADSIALWRSPNAPVAEAFRTLRTNLGFSRVDNRLRAVLVTSAMPGEGKTTVACNLAVAYSQAGKRVYLMDADLRRPGVHPTFALPNNMGLSTLLRAEELTTLSPVQVAYQVDHDLRVITTGPLPPNPAELLDSQRMRDLISLLVADADIVVIDSPPTLAAADAAILATITDGAILVIDTAATKRSAVVRARDTLARVDATVLGVVLNKLSGRADTYYYRYYQQSPELKPGSVRIHPSTASSIGFTLGAGAIDLDPRGPSPPQA